MVGGPNLYMYLRIHQKRLLNKCNLERMDENTLTRADMITEWSQYRALRPSSSIDSDQPKAIMEETTMKNEIGTKPKPRSLGTNDAQVVFCSHCGRKM